MQNKRAHFFRYHFSAPFVLIFSADPGFVISPSSGLLTDTANKARDIPLLDAVLTVMLLMIFSGEGLSQLVLSS
jgi:hypothetical protein